MNSNYKISDAGIALIQHEEGCKLTSYRDSVNVLTIGVGHTGPDVKLNQTITMQRAIELLHADIKPRIDAVNAKVNVPLSQNNVDSLCSLIFNIGVGAFSGSTLLKKINAKAPEKEIRAEFAKWNKGTKNGVKIALPGLTARRGREADLYFS